MQFCRLNCHLYGEVIRLSFKLPPTALAPSLLYIYTDVGYCSHLTCTDSTKRAALVHSRLAPLWCSSSRKNSHCNRCSVLYLNAQWFMVERFWHNQSNIPLLSPITSQATHTSTSTLFHFALLLIKWCRVSRVRFFSWFHIVTGCWAHSWCSDAVHTAHGPAAKYWHRSTTYAIFCVIW